MLTQRRATATRPTARFEKLVVTETADEVLLYDTEKHHIHHLNVTTAAVWRLCDGKHTVVDLARETGQALGASVDENTVRLALTKLDDAGLLKQSLADELRMSRMSRRTFMQRAGVAGAIAVPALVSISSAAGAAFSKTTCGKDCLQDTDCVYVPPSTNPVDCPTCVFLVCDETPPEGDLCGRFCRVGTNDCKAGGQGNRCNDCIGVSPDDPTIGLCGANNFQCFNTECASDNECAVNVELHSPSVACVYCNYTGNPGKPTQCSNVDLDGPDDEMAARNSTMLMAVGGSVSVNPAEGAAGDAIQVDVSGFAPGDQVSIAWGATGSVLGVVVADDSGAGSLPAAVPQQATPGANSIVASNVAGDTTASTDFNVTGEKVEEKKPELKPAMSVEPASGLPGTQVTVSVSGFDPAESVSISFAGAPVADLPNDGATSLTIPDMTAASYTFDARGVTSGVTTSAGFEVLEPPFVPNPVVTVSTSVVKPGDVITAWVSGFHPDEVVSVTLDGTQVGTTGEGGAVDIQMSQPGSHVIGGYGQTTSASNSVTVTVETPAPQPQPELQQAPAAAPTQEATQVPTQEPTQIATQVPTQVPTEAPGTEVPGTEVSGTEVPDTSGT